MTLLSGLRRLRSGSFQNALTLEDPLDTLQRRWDATVLDFFHSFLFYLSNKHAHVCLLHVIFGKCTDPEEKKIWVDDGSSIDYTKLHLSQVKEVTSEEADSAEEFGIKDEPDEIPIKEEAGFIKSEEEDFPCTIVTVRIGENGEVEETDEPAFSLALDPQRHLKKSGQNVNSLETDCSDDLNMNSESPVNQMPIKPKKHRLVQGPHKYELEDLDRTKTGETSSRFQDEETSGEGSSLTPAMS